MHIYAKGSCVPQETYTGEFPEDSPRKYQKHMQHMWVVVILGKINRQSMFHYITHAAEAMRSEVNAKQQKSEPGYKHAICVTQMKERDCGKLCSSGTTLFSSWREDDVDVYFNTLFSSSLSMFFLWYVLYIDLYDKM